VRIRFLEAPASGDEVTGATCGAESPTAGWAVARSGGCRGWLSAPSSSVSTVLAGALPGDTAAPAKRSSKEARGGAGSSGELSLSSRSEARYVSKLATCMPGLIGTCDPRKTPIASAAIPAAIEHIPGRTKSAPSLSAFAASSPAPGTPVPRFAAVENRAIEAKNRPGAVILWHEQCAASVAVILSALSARRKISRTCVAGAVRPPRVQHTSNGAQRLGALWSSRNHR
jgi:hypothetical protein